MSSTSRAECSLKRTRQSELLNDERVAGMATRYGVTVPQLSIRYALQLGLLPLPKTGNPKHMEDNARVDFTIADSDMDALKELRS